MNRSFLILSTLCKLNFNELSRDWVATFFSFFFPVGFLALYGLSDVFQRPVKFEIGIVTTPEYARAGALIENLNNRPLITTREMSFSEGLIALRDGKLNSLIVMDSMTDQPAGIRVLVTDRWADTAHMIISASQTELFLDELGIEIAFETTIEPPPVEVLSELTFVFPGLFAMALLQLGLYATASPLLRARDRGTLLHLSLTSVSHIQIILAQIVMRLSLSGLQMILLIGLGVMAFDIQLAHNWWLLVPILALGSVMLISMGYAIAGLAPTQESGMVIILIANIFMMIFGQTLTDFTDLAWFTPLVYASPLSYLSDTLRQLMLSVSGLLPIWQNTLIMFGWTALSIFIALKSFRFHMRGR